jgi:tetratricopeptide (TPR) repeat protein
MRARDAHDGAPLVLLGLIDESSGDRAGAEDAYTESIRRRAALETPYLRLSALLLEDKRVGDALVVARAGAARFPASPALHVSVATALATKGDEAGASKEFELAAGAGGRDPAPLLAHAKWATSWKRNDVALAKLRDARALTKDPHVLVEIANAMKSLGAFSDCVPTLDRALAIKDDPDLRTHRAICELADNDAAGAKADLELAIGANFAPAHFYLARLLSDRGDWSGAVAEYKVFLTLEPNVPAAKAARERLRIAEARASK